MSESSATIPGKVMSLLKRVNDINILIAHGFIRESMKKENDIPSDIINYCIIYAFLAINEWILVDKYYSVDADNKNKLTVFHAGNKGFRSSNITIYADPIIDIDNGKGKYEWKVRNIALGARIGITNHLNGRIDTHFYGAGGSANENNKSSYCYACIGTKMDHTMSGSVGYGDNQRFRTEDIITVHLDLDKKSIGFSRNDKYLGIAFENIASGKYRFAISVYNSQRHRFEFIQ